MSDEVKVTPHGEIVARCIEGEVWTEPDPDGISLTIEEGDERPRKLASALLSREDMAAWCRRVLAEVDPDPVPTVDELMEAWGVRDLQVRVVSRPDEPLRVVVNSDEVMRRGDDLSLAGADTLETRARHGSVIGIGPTHADALRNALANAAGPWGDLP